MEGCALTDCNEQNCRKLTENEQDLAIRRMEQTSIVTCEQLCINHYNKFIKLYKTNQKVCCDPLNKHTSTKIKKGLREITLNFSKEVKHKVILIPGKKICINCIDLVKKMDTSSDTTTEDESQNKSSTSSEGIEPSDPEEGCSTQYDPVEKTLETLGLSPLDARSLKRKKSYVEEKTKQVVKKFRRSLEFPEINPDEEEETEIIEEHENKQQCFDEILNGLKSAYRSGDRNEQF